MAYEKIPNLIAWLEEYGIEGTIKNGEFITLCPFHEDTIPSLNIKLDEQIFYCHACNAKGDIFSFLATILKSTRAAIYKAIISPKKKVKVISEKQIIEWNQKLKKSGTWLKKLEQKGISLETIESYLLGYDNERITIPIKDNLGNIINVRRYLPDAKREKFLNILDMGSMALYPIESLEQDNIIICEGELKALLVCQLGFYGISSTSGANSLKPQFNKLFNGKNVVIIFDIDKAGIEAAKLIANNLSSF